MQIYGWNSGSFTNETVKWFADRDNRILGTEPAVKFGDFNGDGNVDMGVAHGTDMEYYGPSYVYFNSGEEFSERVQIEHSELWGHDAAVADFNDDGYDDFLIGSLGGSVGGNIALALGSKDNSFRTIQADSELGNTSGLGLATGDFLNDGSVTVVATGGSKEQELYSLDFSGSKLEMDRISVLPDSRFELSKWDDEKEVQFQDTRYSVIRALTFDFDDNGIDDVVTFSTLNKEDDVHGYTEVQFLENDGSGNFTDVTDEVLKEFDTEQHVSYNPRLVDVNGDGLLDIMMSEVTTSVLLQQNDGSFVERFKEDFDAYNQTIRKQIAGQADGAEPENAIVTGPDGAKFLVSKVNQINDLGGFEENKIFLSEIGGNGTITVATTVEALKNQWTWMTDEQASEILSLTASGSVDGVPVIDYTQAMAPIGGLPMVGHVNGVDFASSELAVVGQDDFDRAFEVDLSESAVGEPLGLNTGRVNLEFDRSGQVARSAGLVGGSSYEWRSLYVQQDDQDPNEFTLSLPSVEFAENWYLTAQFTQLNGSPWLDMSGFWGEVDQSETTEAVVSYSSASWVASLGVMQSQTDISPGLITAVSDVQAVWTEFGWQESDNQLGIYAGIDPYVTRGVVNVTLPTSTDVTGEVQYATDSVPLDTALSPYLRVASQFKPVRDLELSVGAVARSQHGGECRGVLSFLMESHY
jgi:hypothetical protein